MKLCVFCSARKNLEEKYKLEAQKCGEMIAKNGITLVYGGTPFGLMKEISHAVITNKGKVIGVYPNVLNQIEPINYEVTHTILVDTMGVRKDVMISNSDAFLILPGGIGTLDEFFEVITLKDLKVHKKQIIIYNFDGYWDPLIALCNHMVKNGFAPDDLFSYMTVVDKLEDIFAVLGFSN